jgi:hypothetical protein
LNVPRPRICRFAKIADAFLIDCAHHVTERSLVEKTANARPEATD